MAIADRYLNFILFLKPKPFYMQAISPRRYSYMILLLVLFVISSCKKDSGKDDASDEYYLSATVNGEKWAANLKIGPTNVSAGSQSGLLMMLGLQKIGTDTTALIIALPINSALNQPVTFNPALQSLAGYVSIVNSFIADPAKGGSGTVTLTHLDETAHIAEGYFSAVAVRTQGPAATKMTISDGKFKIRYEENTSPVVPDLKR